MIEKVFGAEKLACCALDPDRLYWTVFETAALVNFVNEFNFLCKDDKIMYC